MRGGRVVSVALVVLGVLALVLGRVGLLVFVILVAVSTGGELYRMARARGVHPAALTGLVSIAALSVAAHAARRESAFPAVIAGAIGLALLVVLARRVRAGVTRGLLYTLLPVLVVGLLAAYVLALRGARDGFRLVAVLGLISILADVGAAVVAGRGVQPVARAWWRRLMGAIVGALAGATLSALLFSRPITWGIAMTLAAVIAPVVTVADAIAKMIEEDLGAARATLLRRVDGVLLAAPVFFYAYRLLAR